MRTSRGSHIWVYKNNLDSVLLILKQTWTVILSFGLSHLRAPRRRHTVETKNEVHPKSKFAATLPFFAATLLVLATSLPFGRRFKCFYCYSYIVIVFYSPLFITIIFLYLISSYYHNIYVYIPRQTSF